MRQTASLRQTANRRKPARIDDALVAAVAELRRQGLTRDAVAVRLDVTKEAVTRVLRRLAEQDETRGLVRRAAPDLKKISAEERDVMNEAILDAWNKGSTKRAVADLLHTTRSYVESVLEGARASGRKVRMGHKGRPHIDPSAAAAKTAAILEADAAREAADAAAAAAALPPPPPPAKRAPFSTWHPALPPVKEVSPHRPRLGPPPQVEGELLRMWREGKTPAEISRALFLTERAASFLVERAMAEGLV